ncbi:MAG: DNA/RNA non-specific endonuclease [Lachnospiraceae bacterium]|nr:DNA/RNA non-specific endonuclease [Lachnospiraceae bacterium]
MVICLFGQGMVSKAQSTAPIPEYAGEAYAPINNNEPYFTEEEKRSTRSFERYSELDSTGRCGAAFANVGKDLMPTKKRGAIGEVKPTGWHTVKYDFIDGKYLYNRCHLLGYQLTGENANPKNLITGTRYLNVEGMLPFEDMVTDYVKETKHHVLYRVTPVFTGNHLVADGVQMEGWSVEDEGDGICFNVFVYNVQPGVTIDYATGDSEIAAADAPTASTTSRSTKEKSTGENYIINKNTKKFHKSSCSSVSKMSEKNKKTFTGDRQTLIDEGYEPCKRCKP